MREIVLAIASFAGAAILTALAVFLQPDSPFWKWVLWGGIGILTACAVILLIDYFRPGTNIPMLIGMGIGLALFIGCAIPIFFESPIVQEKSTIPSYTGKLISSETNVLLDVKNRQAKLSLEIGDSGAGFVFTGPQGTPLFTFSKNSNLIIESIDGEIKVSTQILDQEGHIIAELIRNEWKVAPPPKTWDRNYTSNALEVRNADGKIIFQVRVLPDRIQIQGDWWGDQGKGIRLVKSDDPTHLGGLLIHLPIKDTDHVPDIKPMFLYPSELHFGELAK